MHPHLHTKDNRGMYYSYLFLASVKGLLHLCPTSCMIWASCSVLTRRLGCEEVMAALDECHARGFLHKMFGGCNEAKLEVNRCLRAERLERTARNRETAKAKKEKIQRVWQEIDEQS